eukprot:scaffold11689_cov16-Tisochrysis_lutea.AAC.1
MQHCFKFKFEPNHNTIMGVGMHKGAAFFEDNVYTQVERNKNVNGCHAFMLEVIYTPPCLPCLGQNVKQYLDVSNRLQGDTPGFEYEVVQLE